MAELSTRLARLSPEKQQLVRQLSKFTTAQSQPPSAPALPSATDMILSETVDSKAACREFYDAVSLQLDASVFGEFSVFLNYGYVPTLNPQFAAVQLSEHVLNRNSTKLVLEVLEDCITAGARVLDAGCGRGGTASVITNFFKPARVIGLDLSAAAVAFCKRTHRHPALDFVQGDCECLPFASASFDMITNIESSSCYPNLFSFYSEAARVLVPGGFFLYSDCLPVERLAEGVSFLVRVGFAIERDRDITPNVLASCDEIAKARVGAYSNGGGAGVLNNFLGTPGSQYYEHMRNGRWAYRIFRLRKTG
jgi:phthiocerol/phenolphthiocerol synthesis type-I polyketide synthase E